MTTVVAFQIDSILRPVSDDEMLIDAYSFFGDSGSLSGVSTAWVLKHFGEEPIVGDYVVVPESLKVFLMKKVDFETIYEYVAKGSPWVRAMGDEYKTKEKT